MLLPALSAELVLECGNPPAVKTKVDKFLLFANMCFTTTERGREVAIDIRGRDEDTVRLLHGALLRVAFAKMFDGVTRRIRYS